MNHKIRSTFIPILTGLAIMAVAPVHAQDPEASSDADLAKELANPISFLFLLPVAIFTFFLRNHLLRGVTFGAIRK